MTDEGKIAEYRAGHAERMKAAQARVDENLRKHAEGVAREEKRAALVARIEKHGGKVHDGNCCEEAHIDLPPEFGAMGIVDVDLAKVIGDDAELAVLERIANLLEEVRP